eukprot:CAMPEP_0119108824 /NCGR_PEP_ID=MMETSP1180-20130426/15677_1 /TAXON_ID=3052 ORGANISM="Chlamydomonas cf sp, Strain CCMP681" /NCGR_SAMPLE_ID=MMETSP1180 /ASSEMBLY_ACC=CAM_ASM_000741 /LENGTH=309 /DNA_ID=CAMNT_0007094481 /DNA_START=65 /DNA_END=994 /DNA_ORIENTATION=-
MNFLLFKGPRSDMYTWARGLKRFFRLRIVKYGKNSLYKAGPVLFLCNHRSWADFFVDTYLTEGTASLMSRWLVFWVFPFFISAVIVLKGIVLFKRGVVADKEKFNAGVDEKLKASPVSGLLVYPEGTRNVKPGSLPLKRGMLYYAHSRAMPVQLIITKNKEGVLGEKTQCATWGLTLVTGFSKVLPTAGTEFEEFWQSVQLEWDRLWQEVHAADAAGLPEVVHDNVPLYDYSHEIRVNMCAVTSASMVGLLVALLIVDKVLFLVTGFAGLLVQKVLLAGLLIWLVSSFVNSSIGVKEQKTQPQSIRNGN